MILLCVYFQLKVIGDDVTIAQNGGPRRQTKNVLHVFIYPQYDVYLGRNDIAVLKTDTFVQSKTLRPADLATKSPAAGTTCTLAGFGVTKEGGTKPNPALFKANLTVSDFTACNASYSGLLSANMFCAKGQAQDACQGDSGGALLCGGAVNGVVSFGNACDHPLIPGVYTDITHFSDFIDECLRTPIVVEEQESKTNGETDNSKGWAKDKDKFFFLKQENYVTLFFFQVSYATHYNLPDTSDGSIKPLVVRNLMYL